MKNALLSHPEKLYIIYDDIRNHRGTVFGLARYIDAEKVNLMTKIGKGLIYVCINEEKANKLELPLMAGSDSTTRKPFGTSVDHIDTTTGISAYERALTIKAFTQENIKPEDFKRPGHIFPLITKAEGMVRRNGVADSVVYLAEMNSNVPVAYTCEMLNGQGGIATKEEVENVAQENGLDIIHLSDVFRYCLEHTDFLEVIDQKTLKTNSGKI